MRKVVLIFLLMMFSTPFMAQEATDLVGNWKIDLRPTPESDGYFQFFEVKAIEGNTFSGTFYGSPISGGLINTNWPKLYFSFTSSDNTHDYYHSGFMENGIVQGVSYCPGRAFVQPWVGKQE